MRTVRARRHRRLSRALGIRDRVSLNVELIAKKSYALAFICCLAASAFMPATAIAAAKGKVLFVASNVLDMGDPEKHDARNNLWGYAPPFHVFVMHGYEVDFVSPKGGRVDFMMDPLGISSYAIRYENFLGKAGNTLKPVQVDAAQYQAVYVGAGYGTFASATRSMTPSRGVLVPKKLLQDSLSAAGLHYRVVPIARSARFAAI